MGKDNRLDWVDAAKGLSILLVVMMYAAYNVGEHTGEVGALHYVIGFATPFRMPEFFLISGLFLSQVIERPWRRYADRRVVHYLYFYVVWVVIDLVLKAGIANQDVAAMAKGIAMAMVEPYGVLWFIYMLAVFSVAAKLCAQLRLPHWQVIAISAALQMAHIDSPSYALDQFAAYFVFFYIGYAGSTYVFRIVDGATQHPRWAWAGLAAWAIAEAFLVFWPEGRVQPTAMHMGLAAFPPLHLALAVVGAVALCVLASLLMRQPYTGWLRWLGAHSLVVYLSFTLPMSAVRIVAMKAGILNDPSALALAVFVLSVLAPVVLYLAIKRIGIGEFLFERPGWAHLPDAGDKRGKSLSIRPAE
jgi:uncharacterized membrane protein YcfT